MWFAQTDPSVTVVTVNNTSSGWLAGAAFVYFLVVLLVAIVAIVAHWKIFTKAGEAGWKSIIPIYNVYIILKIIGRPGWWLLLLFIPFVNIIVAVVVALDLAKSFGKSELFGIVGLFIFSLIGYLILAFGDAKYVGPAAGGGSAPSAQAPQAS